MAALDNAHADGDGDFSMPPPRPAWRERRRRRILEAAASLFGRQGFRQVNMDEVAAAALVGKATLYRYFPSKRDLYLAIFDAALEDVATRLEDVAASGGPARIVLEQVIAALLQGLADHIRDLRMTDEGLVVVTERKRRLLRARRHDISDRIARIFADGVASGELRDIDPQFCADLLVGMVWAGAVTMPMTTAPMAATIADILLNGTLAIPAALPSLASLRDPLNPVAQSISA